jgi:hypothetical protein
MTIIETQGFKLDNSGKRIVVDPITRIEGHLRIEVNVDDKNVIRNAVSTGTMWRGLEVILKGRDPRDAWAFVERICGVCTGTHALASVRSVEDALGIQIPKNANLIRNLMHSTLYAHDHLVHFYHLHALERGRVVPDRLRSRLHRLLRARLLGQRAVLRAAPQPPPVRHRAERRPHRPGGRRGDGRRGGGTRCRQRNQACRRSQQDAGR